MSGEKKEALENVGAIYTEVTQGMREAGDCVQRGKEDSCCGARGKGEKGKRRRGGKTGESPHRSQMREEFLKGESDL